MGTKVIKAETWLEKIGVYIDKTLYYYFKKYDFGKRRLVETKCEFCQKEITIWRTLFNKQSDRGICCSEECARIVLRHF
jgi:hypothetical protein